MRPGTRILDAFLVGPHYFLADQSPFWSKHSGEKLNIVVAVLDNNAENCSVIALP